MDHIGIDVHKRDSQICILAEGGEVIERRCRTERARLAELLGERGKARIVIEASTESEWVAQCLEQHVLLDAEIGVRRGVLVGRALVEPVALVDDARVGVRIAVGRSGSSLSECQSWSSPLVSGCDP